jgi:hypothetical protein
MPLVARPVIRSFAAADAYLGRRTSRRLPGRETTIARLCPSRIVVTYRGTHVVTYHRDGRITLRSGGHLTVTTRSRWNTYAPVSAYQRHFVTYVRPGASGALPSVDVVHGRARVTVGRYPIALDGGRAPGLIARSW